jgi:hypothetical protein
VDLEVLVIHLDGLKAPHGFGSLGDSLGWLDEFQQILVGFLTLTPNLETVSLHICDDYWGDNPEEGDAFYTESISNVFQTLLDAVVRSTRIRTLIITCEYKEGAISILTEKHLTQFLENNKSVSRLFVGCCQLSGDALARVMPHAHTLTELKIHSLVQKRKSDTFWDQVSVATGQLLRNNHVLEKLELRTNGLGFTIDHNGVILGALLDSQRDGDLFIQLDKYNSWDAQWISDDKVAKMLGFPSNDQMRRPWTMNRILASIAEIHWSLRLEALAFALHPYLSDDMMKHCINLCPEIPNVYRLQQM